MQESTSLDRIQLIYHLYKGVWHLLPFRLALVGIIHLYIIVGYGFILSEYFIFLYRFNYWISVFLLKCCIENLIYFIYLFIYSNLK